MPITADEIKYFESTNNLGGAITAVEVVDATLHNLFDLVSSDGALLGETNYRCIYVKNVNTSLTLIEALLYIVANTPLTSTELAIGVGTSINGGVEQIIPDEDTAPPGVVFSDLIGSGNGLPLGNLITGGHQAIWLRRIVAVDASAAAGDGATISVQGNTVA